MTPSPTTTSSTLFAKIKAYAFAHKVISAVVAIVIIWAGYKTVTHFTSGGTTTKYVLATATKGTLITSVSGSGQVAATEQVDIDSTVSGTVDSVLVNPGDTVAQNQVIATIDNADAIRAVNNAQLALENAQVAYQKAVKDDADQAATSTSSDLAKAYQSGYNAVVAASIDLPAIFATMDDIYYTPSHSSYFTDVNITSQASTADVTYKEQAGAELDDAKSEYDANFTRYKDVSINSSPTEIEGLLNETNTILQKLLNALSSTYSTLDDIQNKENPVPAQLTTDKSSITGFVSKVNADSSSVTAALTDIDNSQSSGTDADLAMKSAQLTVSQDEAALTDAQTTLDDHDIKAPFDGEIAKVSAKVNDTANNGYNVATIVTPSQVVDISLNEIDAAKVAKNDKVTLTFDAINDLTLTGHVTNVDLVGTVSQGVVTYTVEIAFDDTDPRVKPGMTVNAEIITAVQQDALLLPSSAVKTSGTTSYVQELGQKYSAAEAAAGVVSSTAPVDVAVTTGGSNDTQIEITSGVSEGDQVVSSTKTGAAATAKSTTPSLLGSLGGGARTFGGGGVGGATGATRTTVRAGTGG